MGPAVRRTRPKSRITAAPVEDPNYSGPKVGISGACGPTSHSKPAGNGFFGCRDKAPKTITKKGECLQRPKSGKQVAGNPRRTALFGVDCGKGGLRRLDGGVRSQLRTGLSLISGLLQRIFANSCLLLKTGPTFATLIQWLAPHSLVIGTGF